MNITSSWDYFFFLENYSCIKKGHSGYGWRCPLLWTVQNFCINRWKMCAHIKKWQGIPLPFLYRKIFRYAESFLLCRNFLLCRKFSVMQKNFLVMLKNCTESFLSYRKISVMQKIFCYTEKFLIKQKIFLSCKKKKLCRKFSCMQKNLFWLCEKEN